MSGILPDPGREGYSWAGDPAAATAPQAKAGGLPHLLINIPELTAQNEALRTENEGLRGQLAEVRRRLLSLATELEDSAGTTFPSKKSDVEARCADRVSQIASYAGMPGVEPAGEAEGGDDA